MTVLKIEGMHCGGCVARIEKALGAKGYDFKVSLENKTVEINGDDGIIKDAADTIEDLGFEVVK